MDRCVCQIVDADAGDFRTPEIFTNPIAMVPIEDNARYPINENWLCTKSFCAASKAEEITSFPFLQCLVRFEETRRDPLNLVMRSHGSILPVSTVL